jgi:hypothetical protein
VAVAAVSKDASAITVTTPVRRGGWHGRNDGKDASNRGNATGNNQPAKQKDERAVTLCGRGWPREMCEGFLQFYILAKKKIFSVNSNLLVFLLCY